MHKDGKQKTVRVHQLVAEAFIGTCPKGMQARHLDGNRMNPCLSNLEYGTATQNEADKKQHGTHDKKFRKIDKSRWPQIITRRENGETFQAIADDYGVRDSTILRVYRAAKRAHP